MPAALLCLLVVACGPLCAGTPDAEALVGKLGDESLATRKQATQELIALGTLAREALTRGLKSKNAEVRTGCLEVLTVLYEESEAEIAYFVQTGKTRDPKLIPGYERFVKLCGRGEAEGKVYAQILDEAKELYRPELGTTPGVEFVKLRMIRQYQQRVREAIAQNLSPDDIHLRYALTVLCIHADPKYPRQMYEMHNLLSCLDSPAVVQTLSASKVGQALMKAIVDDLAKGDAHEVWTTYLVAQRLQLRGEMDRLEQIGRKLLDTKTKVRNELRHELCMAQVMKLREGLNLALARLDEPKLDRRGLATACQFIGEWGDRAHVERLQKLFTNATNCHTIHVDEKHVAVQVRDVALAACVQLTGQKLADYGFPYYRANPDKMLQVDPHEEGFSGFAGIKQREAAFERWREWAQANLRKR